MSDSVSSLKRVQAAFQNDSTQFVAAYVISGILAILIPGITYAARMGKYRNSYYYAYVQQENNEGYSGDWRDANDCKWWQWGCSPKWVNGNGEAREEEGQGNQYYQTSSVPSWISGWVAGAGDSRDGNITHSSKSLKFVYAWQMILFLLLLAYGSMVIFKYRGNLAQSRVALHSLWILIFIFGNFCFLSMWMLANGSIYVDGRELEEVGGFYHQFSVLMFTTNFWYVLWTIVFVVALGRRISNISKAEATAEKEGMDYVPYSETDAETGVSPPAKSLS